MVQMHYDICETESMNTVTVQVTVRSQPRLSVSHTRRAQDAGQRHPRSSFITALSKSKMTLVC